MMLSGARFILRFLIRTVSWWAVFVGKRYLLIKGFGNSVPSKCFRPKANKLKKEGEERKKNSLLTVLWNLDVLLHTHRYPSVCILATLHTKKAHTCVCWSVILSTYLSSALVKIILSRGGFAFKEHTGSSSGYIKTLLVAKIHATCFGKHGKSLAVRR